MKKQIKRSAEEQEKLDAAVKKYVGGMDAPGNGIDYTRLPIDTLLTLEAINDWSGRCLIEGGEIEISCRGTDPCAATETDALNIAKQLHRGQWVLYPVSSFGLSAEGALNFNMSTATYRMTPHTSGSRADAITIAEGQPVDDAEAATRLWTQSAVEDCIGYLFTQMEKHRLSLSDEELTVVRDICASALKVFSIAQIWSATWRIVQQCAALSTREFYNCRKASQQIPKKLDKALNDAIQSAAELPAYDRIESHPMGAVLTLMARKFGIGDTTSGVVVRNLFEEAARNAPERSMGPGTEEEIDYFSAIVGELYLSAASLSAPEKYILSFFSTLSIKEPAELDENTGLYVLPFSCTDMHGFDTLRYITDVVAAVAGHQILFTDEEINARAEEIGAVTRSGVAYRARRSLLLDKAKQAKMRPEVLDGLEALSPYGMVDMRDIYEHLLKIGLADTIKGVFYTSVDAGPEYVFHHSSTLVNDIGIYRLCSDTAVPGTRPVDFISTYLQKGEEALGIALADMVSEMARKTGGNEILLRAMAKQLVAIADQREAERDVIP